MDPTAEKLHLPTDYGTPLRTLAWADVDARLAAAPRYWLATSRPDGRPHAVPVDGLWVDGECWFGGSSASVHHRNLQQSPNAVIHLEDGAAAVIVEGTAASTRPGKALAEKLAALSNAKYGYGMPPEMFQVQMWRLRTQRVLAWTEYPADATRFLFPDLHEG